MIKEHGISPSESWALDMCEIYAIIDKKVDEEQDGSYMLNEIRKMNGMPESLIKNMVA